MIRNLLQSLPRRQFFMTTRTHMKSSQPHEVAESEEKDSHEWGKVTEKDTSFDDIESDADKRNAMSTLLKSGEDYGFKRKIVPSDFNVEHDKWCS